MRAEYNTKEQCYYIYHDIKSGDVFNGWWRFQPCAFYDGKKLFADSKAGFKDFGFKEGLPTIESAIDFLLTQKSN